MRDEHAALIRGCALPAAATAVACCLAGALAAGTRGLAAAAFGALTVGAFLGLSLVAMVLTDRLDPAVTTVIALGSYAAKVVLLVVVLAGAVDAEGLSRPVLVLSVVAVSTVWLGGAMRGHAAQVRRSAPERGGAAGRM